MTPKETILKHKDFITAIATLGHLPQKDNIYLKELIDAWQTELKTIKSKVVYAECGSCGGGWIAQVKDFYVYAKKNEWI
jgi:pyruvate-formate lyase-activating enzyme